MALKDWRRLLHFRCTGCGNCCRGTVVCITDEDVRRIVAATGKSPRDFVRFFTEEEVEMDRRSPLWVRFDPNRAVMALRSVDDRCVFLDGDNRCTIYEHRPVTCRQYPFNVELSDTGGIERLSLSRAAKCLHDWDGKVTRRSLHAVLQWNDDQEEVYVRKVREWNRLNSAPKTRPGFLRFLGLIDYENAQSNPSTRSIRPGADRGSAR